MDCDTWAHFMALYFLVIRLGSFLGVILGGYFYDQFGSYNYAWYLSMLLSIFAGFGAFTN